MDSAARQQHPNPTAAPALGMVLKGYPRISETFISNELLLLENLGFAIHIFSMRKPRENFSHASVKHIRARVDYLPETLLLPLPRFLYHNLLLAARSPKVFIRTLKTAWRRFLRTRKAATFKHFLQAGYLVQRLLPGSGVIHFHAHFAHSPASVAMFAARLSGLSFSFTAHAKDIYTSDPRQLAEKLSEAKFAVTCTEYNRRHLLDLVDGNRAPSTSIQRVYHGIDVELFARAAPAVDPGSIHRILTIARLTAKKGLPTVLGAIDRLKKRGFAIEHTLIGDGEDRRQILARIRRLGLEDTTRWLGTLPHEVVLTHYRQAAVFVLGCEVAPNGDRDGIPNVLMESMAMGVPVVATRVSAIPELVEDGTTGLLVSPGDPEQLADAIQRLLTDRSLRERIIENSRQRVRQHFDNRQLIGDLAAIYRQHVPGL
jgi:glycosyltransferase involved in cell wall biosynthesis